MIFQSYVLKSLAPIPRQTWGINQVSLPSFTDVFDNEWVAVLVAASQDPVLAADVFIMGAWSINGVMVGQTKGDDREVSGVTTHDPDPDLNAYLFKIGNDDNQGTFRFPVFHNWAGWNKRFWGTINDAPDGNQYRHVTFKRLKGNNWQATLNRWSHTHDPAELSIQIVEAGNQSQARYVASPFLLEGSSNTWIARPPTPISDGVQAEAKAQIAWHTLESGVILPGADVLPDDHEQHNIYLWDEDKKKGG